MRAAENHLTSTSYSVPGAAQGIYSAEDTWDVRTRTAVAISTSKAGSVQDLRGWVAGGRPAVETLGPHVA